MMSATSIHDAINSLGSDFPVGTFFCWTIWYHKEVDAKGKPLSLYRAFVGVSQIVYGTLVQVVWKGTNGLCVNDRPQIAHN